MSHRITFQDVGPWKVSWETIVPIMTCDMLASSVRAHDALINKDIDFKWDETHGTVYAGGHEVGSFLIDLVDDVPQ